MKTMKLWEKNYHLDKQVEDFTVGDDYILDHDLVKYDCLASIAHSKMLGEIGILTDKEVQLFVRELNRIIKLSESDQFIILKELEDSHTAIENYLTEQLGDLGKKIHTARSRNDQVLTALRLYYKDQLSDCIKLVKEFIKSLSKFVNKFGDIEIPGFTHSRKAMPSSTKMWSNSFIDSMKDNHKLLEVSFELIDQSPLGTGAGYGIPLKLDRELTKKELDFSKLQDNPIYSQNSRGKFESTIIHSLGQVLFDINKIATDLLLFSMEEFGYFELPNEICTGSSIMPHKKNPDVLELLRAKYHVVLSYEFQIKNLMSNLISGYNRDLQLTKEPIMKSFQITQDCLKIITLVFDQIKVNKENCKNDMTDELFAMNDVYDLVKKGIPFRDAYKKVAQKFI